MIKLGSSIDAKISVWLVLICLQYDANVMGSTLLQLENWFGLQSNIASFDSICLCKSSFHQSSMITCPQIEEKVEDSYGNHVKAELHQKDLLIREQNLCSYPVTFLYIPFPSHVKEIPFLDRFKSDSIRPISSPMPFKLQISGSCSTFLDLTNSSEYYLRLKQARTLS